LYIKPSLEERKSYLWTVRSASHFGWFVSEFCFLAHRRLPVLVAILVVVVVLVKMRASWFEHRQRFLQSWLS
jgi:hypothetical protein